MLLAGVRGADELIELRVRAAPAPGAAYPLELQVADGPQAQGALALDLAALLAEADPHAYGRALGGQLFADAAVAGLYREVLALVRAAGQGLRVRLWLDPAAPELQSIAWERLYQPAGAGWQPLATAADTPPARMVSSARWDQPAPRLGRPLRALLVAAAPAGLGRFGLDPIDPAEIAAHAAALSAHAEIALAELVSGGPTPPTLAALAAALPGADLVHILCHGAATAGGSVLYLEREGGGVDPVTSERLVAALAALQPPPQLIFLAACDSAARAASDAFVPLGPALVAAGGAPLVVAMRERLSAATARPLVARFYERLLAHGQADLALSEARALVAEQWDWGAAVLFSRLSDCAALAFPLDAGIADGMALPEAAGRALAIARRAAPGQALVGELERLLGEWGARYAAIADYGARLRRTGSDPAGFAAAFEPLYNDLKEHYDRETWADEEALVRQTVALVGQALPALRPAMPAADHAQLAAVLQRHVATRAGLVNSLRDALELLNADFDAIEGLLVAGDVAGAIRRKQAVVAQLSASLSESKERIRALSRDVSVVSAA